MHFTLLLMHFNWIPVLNWNDDLFDIPSDADGVHRCFAQFTFLQFIEMDFSQKKFFVYDFRK